ncbi:MAG TPA: thioredoxin domain-containing protein [Steroidobacteraceae bacterium]|jgi:hypothetical protein|nr:thioredoxin domain-containing protein [Steroidobacteraceae bacterium]
MDERAVGPATSVTGASTQFTNRLATQTSPYLRSHAHNPVDWYPWGEEALERARNSGKPILLSIGYAACHWCHVMAHESFEDPAIAARMNTLYVNIKVDREERPDLDRVYQLAQQMLTGRSGGWPLTLFLMHDDQRPFFGGTYFPRESRFGLPAFGDLLEQVADHYAEHREALRPGADRLVRALGDLNPAPSAQPLTREPLAAFRAQMERSFDGQFGGFGPAPKFPHAPALARLLRSWFASARADVPDLQALYMMGLTLARMAEGGLFDQLGGGFFRYSVDERWEIPHFEKMLYDNAQLLTVYAEAASATGEALFADCARRTVAFLRRELSSAAGAFYSSLDADSEGHEGRFYVWSTDEARSALSEAQWRAFAPRFGLTDGPNFEGRWHLCVRRGTDTIAATLGESAESVAAAIDSAAQRLLTLRGARERPALDDKVLTSWNALAIRALASAARCLDEHSWADTARRALHYLQQHHWQDGRLLAVSAVEGRARLPAYLDDYAFLIDAILELSCLRFDPQELAWAVQLAEVLLGHFEDRAHGGFFFTADDHEVLISRSKSFGDEALPAGNAIAAQALCQLGYLLGQPRYLAAAERTLRASWDALMRYPEGHASMLQALEDFLEPPTLVILRGPAGEIDAWQRELQAVFDPRRRVLAVPGDTAGLPAALLQKPAGERPLAYICRGLQCSAPFESLTQLARELAGTPRQHDAIREPDKGD